MFVFLKDLHTLTCVRTGIRKGGAITKHAQTLFRHLKQLSRAKLLGNYTLHHSTHPHSLNGLEYSRPFPSPTPWVLAEGCINGGRAGKNLVLNTKKSIVG